MARLYCVELDTMNFARTCSDLEKHFGTAMQMEQRGGVGSDGFKVFKSGLFDKNYGMGFCEYGAHSSRITGDESVSEIPVVRLDDAVDDQVTFIKYDLEGTDIPAIKGAEKTFGCISLNWRSVFIIILRICGKSLYWSKSMYRNMNCL